MSDKFKQLETVCNDSDKLELITLHDAWAKNLKIVNNDPSKENTLNYNASKAAKDSLINQLWIKYFQKDEAPAHRNAQAVWEWLAGQGYKVARSTIYKAVKEKRLRPQPDGTVLEAAVKAFILDSGLQKPDQQAPDEQIGEKVAEEIKKLKLQNQKYQLELDIMLGKYLLREDLELEVCSRVGIFEATLRHFFATQAPALVDACGGDRAKAPDVTALMNAALDQLLTAMADVERWQVIMVGQESESRIQN